MRKCRLEKDHKVVDRKTNVRGTGGKEGYPEAPLEMMRTGIQG